jgi:hypothetical protein
LHQVHSRAVRRRGREGGRGMRRRRRLRLPRKSALCPFGD